MKEVRIENYNLGPAEKLSTAAAQQIIVALNNSPKKNRGALGGRAEIIQENIAGLGSVVIKRYMRGGLLRYIVRQKYLRIGASRSEREFEILEQVRALGIAAPEPVAWINRGGFLYETWLVTKEVPGHQTLADISLEDEARAADLIPQVVTGIRKLIELGLWHLDLHPGNVLVDEAGHAIFLDFDRAQKFSGKVTELRDRYLCRWRRAVIKHQLPDLLSELVATGLRKNFCQDRLGGE